MVWYYVSEGKRIGPVDEAEFEAAIETGLVTPSTLVWNETLTKWQRYTEVAPKQPQFDDVEIAPEQPQDTVSQPSAPSSSLHFKTTTAKTHPTKCSECGKTFERDDMVLLRGAWVCAACKPIVVQRLKEGVSLSTEMEYAGFWIRFGAKFIDGIILWIMQFILGLINAFVFYSPGARESTMAISSIFMTILSIAIGAIYTTFFLGKYGATPGKMACGLRVVTPDGDQINYARACGRHFAEILSTLIFFIGYIMAAFDEEKRTLHDRICDTRVIRK